MILIEVKKQSSTERAKCESGNDEGMADEEKRNLNGNDDDDNDNDEESNREDERERGEKGRMVRDSP